MTEWREATIAELCARTTSGGTPSRKRPEFFCDPPDGVPWVKSQELTDRRIRGCAEHITEAGLKGSSARLVPRGSVLVAMYGATVGQLGYLDIAATTNQAICVLITDPSTTDSRFLYYSLMHARSDLVAQAQGAAQQNLSQAVIGQFCLRVPSLPYQHRVGILLSSIDDLIENNRRRVEVLEVMARAIYREWFVHFRYPGHSDAAFVDSPLGPIPEGWETVRLSDLVTTQYGYTESASSEPVGPQYLRGMDINKTSYVDWSAVPYCPIEEKDQAKFKVEPGDVFIIRMADPGKVGMCEVAVDAIFASYLVRLRPKPDRLDPYVLFFTLRDDLYQGWVTGASTGATRKSVSAKVMTEPRVVVPPQDQQESFRKRIGPVRSLLNGLVQQSSELAGIRDLLLPKLVTGQIDVSLLDLGALVDQALGSG